MGATKKEKAMTEAQKDMADAAYSNDTCWPSHAECDHLEYIGRDVTLSGKPATIVQGPRGYAAVRCLEEPFVSVEYSWVAVFNICDNRNGRF